LGTPSILNPKNAFNLTVTKTSRIFLDEQVAKHEQTIMVAVDQGDTELAEWKIKELQKLAEVFDPFDKNYRAKLTSIILKIMEKVRIIVEKALGLLKRCI
jgi:hypothetical protein